MKRLSFLFITFSIICFSLSCDKDSGNPVDSGEVSEYGSIEVRVIDENGNPYEGVELYVCENTCYEDLFPRNRLFESSTNEEGIARFDSIPSGTYTIASWAEYFEGHHAHARKMIDVVVQGGKKVSVPIYYPVGPIDLAVKVALDSEVNAEFANITLYFYSYIDGFSHFLLDVDERGNGVIRDFVFDYSMSGYGILMRYAYRNYVIQQGSFHIFATDSYGWPFYYVKISSSPVLEIINPPNEAFCNTQTIQLTGFGYDFEDMVLSDDAYSWYSDIDGELGTGREIMATLSVGRHTITLTVEDSVGLTSTVSNIVNISHFSEQSYFPMPQNGSWSYQYESPELITTNARGETERWTLENMTVTSDDITSRTCSMEWMVECDGDTYECQYSVTDNIVLDDTCFQITESYETFASYEDTVQIEEMNVETAYTPSCPLLTDYLDPQASNGDVTSVTAESTMRYSVSGAGPLTLQSSETFDISCQTGSPENITTPAGTFSAIPYLSTYNGVERTWWLARGIGIVQMEYDLFGETVRASLYETNMGDFAGSAMKLSTNSRNSDPIRIQFDSSADDAGRMREIMEVMRGMCPR